MASVDSLPKAADQVEQLNRLAFDPLRSTFIEQFPASGYICHPDVILHPEQLYQSEEHCGYLPHLLDSDWAPLLRAFVDVTNHSVMFHAQFPVTASAGHPNALPGVLLAEASLQAMGAVVAGHLLFHRQEEPLEVVNEGWEKFRLFNPLPPRMGFTGYLQFIPQNPEVEPTYAARFILTRNCRLLASGTILGRARLSHQNQEWLRF